MVVAVPVALLVERRQEQVGTFQILQHLLAIAPSGKRIAERAAELLENRRLEQKISHVFRLSLEHLLSQVVQHVAVHAREHRVAPAGLGRGAPFAFQCEQNFQAMAEDDGLGKAMIVELCHFACEEADGYIWVYMSEPGTKSEPAEGPPRLPVFSPRYTLAHLWADLPVSIDHGIIGLMDPAHGPFVHQAWWWRTRGSIRQKTKRFEPIPEGFRMSAHAPSGNSAPYKLLGGHGQPRRGLVRDRAVFRAAAAHASETGRHGTQSILTVKRTETHG